MEGNIYEGVVEKLVNKTNSALAEGKIINAVELLNLLSIYSNSMHTLAQTNIVTGLQVTD